MCYFFVCFMLLWIFFQLCEKNNFGNEAIRLLIYCIYFYVNMPLSTLSRVQIRSLHKLIVDLCRQIDKLEFFPRTLIFQWKMCMEHIIYNNAEDPKSPSTFILRLQVDLMSHTKTLICFKVTSSRHTLAMTIYWWTALSCHYTVITILTTRQLIHYSSI